jgi:hypothetical protein
LLQLFIKDLLAMGNQYFWWASKIRDPVCPGTTTSLLDFRNPGNGQFVPLLAADIDF